MRKPRSKKWSKRFMSLAKFISEWSKDPSTKVGAVIVDKDNRIISSGYNGFAKGVSDESSRYDDRSTKYKIILHAEENAIMFANRNLEGCSLYVTQLYPCAHCASLIIQSGIKEVYIQKFLKIPDRWKESMEWTKRLFDEADVNLFEVD